MYPVMLLTIVFGALVHVHGAFWFALLPCIGLLACYSHTYVYGDLMHEGWYDRLYVRAKITDSDYFVIDRKGSKRVQWVEVGTVHQKEKALFTFTLGCFTFQVGTQPSWMTHDFMAEAKSEKVYTSTTKREMTAEEQTAFDAMFKQLDHTMEYMAKLFSHPSFKRGKEDDKK